MNAQTGRSTMEAQWGFGCQGGVHDELGDVIHIALTVGRHPVFVRCFHDVEAYDQGVYGDHITACFGGHDTQLWQLYCFEPLQSFFMYL